MNIPSSFNLFDVFARLIPGSMLLIGIYCLVGYDVLYMYASKEAIYVLMCLLFSYTLGTLLYTIARKFPKRIIDSLIFGGNPREIYCCDELCKGHSIRVINDEKVYMIAKKCVEEINGRSFTNLNWQQRKRNAHYAMDYMINFIEVCGKNEKEDRMESLAMMCLSLVLVSLILLLISLLLVNIESMIVAITFLASFAYAYEEHTRMRFVNIIRTYSILKDWNIKDGRKRHK